MTKLKDLTGERFGKLIVLARVKKPYYLKSNVPYWLCRCDCGKETVVASTNLKSGKTKSCGCDSKRNRWAYTGV